MILLGLGSVATRLVSSSSFDKFAHFESSVSSGLPNDFSLSHDDGRRKSSLSAGAAGKRPACCDPRPSKVKVRVQLPVYLVGLIFQSSASHVSVCLPCTSRPHISI
jgi:hypothetical protein